MDEDLNSILNEPTTEASEPAAPQAEQSDRARDPATGKFVSASDPGDETPEAPAPEAAPPAAQQEAEPGHIPVAALRDERQKRQELERLVQQYEGMFAQMQQPQQQQPAAPDPEVDFAGWLNWRDQQIAEQVEQRIMQRVEQYGTNVDVQMRGKVGEMLARQRHPDYDQVIQASFTEAVQANPMLQQQLVQQDDPAEYAYRVGKQWAEAKQLSSPDPTSREAAKAELRAEIMAELGLPSQPKAPSSLASERSVGSRSGPAFVELTMEDLLR